MTKFVIALLVLVAVYAAEGLGVSMDVSTVNDSRHRRPNFYYPSLSKFCLTYRCAGRRVLYGRCPSHLVLCLEAVDTATITVPTPWELVSASRSPSTVATTTIATTELCATAHVD
ncbi:hypothetical protein NP493_5217g00000 [Ridgeia piscesae]|uniref:Secreted protein n=1 Tax=Ridgeia piscesae TaxID=27915 RepID=A0AAD9IVV8_RIDPI|nr:hypothetical protein NP493_5217g00000 [Ridgeia piscesae]